MENAGRGQSRLDRIGDGAEVERAGEVEEAALGRRRRLAEIAPERHDAAPVLLRQ